MGYMTERMEEADAARSEKDKYSRPRDEDGFLNVSPAWVMTWGCKSPTGLAVGTVSQRQG